MASQFRETFRSTSSSNDFELDYAEFISTQASAMQLGEDISHSARSQVSVSPNNHGSLAKQELQTLWAMFTSWLQPEKQSKEQMISQLVLEQFLLTGHCKDKFALTEKWKSSGRNMGRFMEGLTDEYLKPPVMVSSWGQKWLCEEEMQSLIMGKSSRKLQILLQGRLFHLTNHYMLEFAVL